MHTIAVFGGTGRIGLQSVNQALESGHRVKIFARKPSLPTPLQRNPNVSIVKGDIKDSESVEKCLKGCTAVFYCLSYNVNEPNTVLSDGITNVINGMKKFQIKRLIVVSSAAINEKADEKAPLFFRIFIKGLLLNHLYDDLVRMEKVILKSDLDWTIIQPPGLVNAPYTGDYEIAIDKLPSGAGWTSRGDVAHYMVKALNTNENVGKIVGLSTRKPLDGLSSSDMFQVKGNTTKYIIIFSIFFTFFGTMCYIPYWFITKYFFK